MILGLDLLLAPSGASLLILIAVVLFGLNRIDEWRKREERKEGLLLKLVEKDEDSPDKAA
jgi:hypothetical protein